MANTNETYYNDNVGHKTSICSYEACSCNFTKRDYVNSLVTEAVRTSVIWIAVVDFYNINDCFLFHANCGFDDCEVLSGRPYAGCAIFWHASLAVSVETTGTISRHV